MADKNTYLDGLVNEYFFGPEDSAVVPSSEGAKMVEEIRAGNRERLIALGEPSVRARFEEAHDPNHILYLDSD